MNSAQQSAPIATAIRRTGLLVMAVAALGGILYGYDLGVISGALVFMKGDLALTDPEMSMIVAAVLGGGSVATLVGGPLADVIGRKLTILASAVIFIVGSIIVPLAPDFTLVMVGRLIQGVGVGLITIVVPLYVVEVVPAALRGRSVTLFQLFLTFGILLGYVIGYAFNASHEWRPMFATILIPAVMFLLIALFAPKSPRWLYRAGQKEKARELLLRMQSPEEVDTTINEMELAGDAAETRNSWAFLLKPGYRKAFLIALAIGILNQLTGVNTILQFNTLILHESGLHGGATAILGSVGVGLTNFVITIIALSLIDKVGRRPLLILGTLGSMFALLFMGLVHAFTPVGLFQGYATLAGFIAFIVFYAIGPGVVVWLAISEIMPLVIRAKGMAIALFANSLASTGLALIFMDVVGAIGYAGIFFILAFFVFLYFLIAYFLLPETKGRNLEEIELYFLGTASRG